MAEYKKADSFMEAVAADAAACLRNLMVEAYYLVWKNNFPTFLLALLKSNKRKEKGEEKISVPIADRSSIVQACSEMQADELLRICDSHNNAIKGAASGKILIDLLHAESSADKKSLYWELTNIENNEIWAEWVNNCFQNIEDKEKQHIIYALDISSCFKINSITGNIDNNIYYQTYNRLFPEKQCDRKNRGKWITVNRNACELRNEIVGHTSKLTGTEAWTNECRNWEDIAKRLRRPEVEEQYQAFVHSIEYGNKQLNFSEIPWKDIVEGSKMPKEFCREVLCEKYNFRDTGACLCCGSLETALNSIFQEIRFRKESEQEAEVIGRQQEMEKVNPAITQAEVQEIVQKENLQKKAKKVPDLKILSNYSGGFLNMPLLRELCNTHSILLDSSLLKSGIAETFITGDLRSAAANKISKGKPPFNVEASSRFEIYKSRKEGSGSYFLMNDALFNQFGLIRYVGVVNPFLDKDDATIQFIKDHKHQRICIFTYGNPGFVKRIKKEDYPLCVIADVSKNWSDKQHPHVVLFKNTLPLTDHFSSEDALQLLEKEENYEDEPTPANEVEAKVETVEKQQVIRPEKQPAKSNVGENPKAAPADINNNISYTPHPSVKEKKPAYDAASKKESYSSYNQKRTKYAETNKISPAFEPSEIHNGDTLYTASHKPVLLTGVLMEGGNEAKGGEGALFETNQRYRTMMKDEVINRPVVAKIYHNDLRTPDRYRKISYMTTHPVKLSNVCWPIDVLFDDGNNFVGFTMMQAPQGCMQLGTSVFKIDMPTIRQSFLSSWKKIDLVQTAYTIALTISELHKREILMGDINPCNFLVNPMNSQEVYLVDCDSYQVGEFPCPVGREEYTHPAIADRLGNGGKVEYGTFFRTLDDEQYSLAVLLFSILMNGQHPCDSKNEDNLPLAMKNREFPYAQGLRNVSSPDYWMIWKNLPGRIRTPFTKNFVDWETTEAFKWAKLLEKYGNLIKNYGFSNEINPTKYYEANPDDPLFVDLICPECGQEFNCTKEEYERDPNIVCLTCQRYYNWLDIQEPRISINCSKCNRTYWCRPSEYEFAQKTNTALMCPKCRGIWPRMQRR